MNKSMEKFICVFLISLVMLICLCLMYCLVASIFNWPIDNNEMWSLFFTAACGSAITSWLFRKT